MAARNMLAWGAAVTMGKDMYTVEEVVRLLGVTPRTLHYYEEVGLFEPASRTTGGHRLYDERAVQRLRHILHLKESMGYSLSEIREILTKSAVLDDLRASYHASLSDDEKVRVVKESIQLLQEVIQDMDSKLSRLTSIRDQFAERLNRCQAFVEQSAKSEVE